jgi:hypothetical protein
MELLLNLIWVLLAVPAFWLWRHEAVPARRNPYLSPLRIVLVLGFVLLLLFPVISATDDLRAMQPETEELPAVRRVCRSAEHGKNNHQVSHAGASPALLAVSLAPHANDECSGLVFTLPISLPATIQLRSHRGRAPPSVAVT